METAMTSEAEDEIFWMRITGKDVYIEEIRDRKPKHVHVCSPCGPFSQLQAINEKKYDPRERERKLVEARVLLHFAVQVCMLQLREGRDFSFEHPRGASSWEDGELLGLRNHEGVHEVASDQCCFGLRDPQSEKLYQKGTRVVTTNEIMCEMLNKRCQRDHEHQKREGKIKIGDKWYNRTRCAQIYRKQMVEAMVKAIKRKIRLGEYETLAVEKLSEKKEGLHELIHRCHGNLGHPRERFRHVL